jgi:hypothetical protein
VVQEAVDQIVEQTACALAHVLPAELLVGLALVKEAHGSLLPLLSPYRGEKSSLLPVDSWSGEGGSLSLFDSVI